VLAHPVGEQLRRTGQPGDKPFRRDGVVDQDASDAVAVAAGSEQPAAHLAAGPVAGGGDHVAHPRVVVAERISERLRRFEALGDVTSRARHFFTRECGGDGIELEMTAAMAADLGARGCHLSELVPAHQRPTLLGLVGQPRGSAADVVGDDELGRPGAGQLQGGKRAFGEVDVAVVERERDDGRGVFAGVRRAQRGAKRVQPVASALKRGEVFRKLRFADRPGGEPAIERRADRVVGQHRVHRIEITPRSRANPAMRDIDVHSPDVTSEALPTVSVVICCYTLDRWDMLVESVESVQRQTVAPVEIIVCVDHNDDLLAKAQAHWQAHPGDVAVRVIANRYDGHLGSARTTAAEIATGDVLAFLDDDAAAEDTWLAELLAPYRDSAVVAVGGAPLPRFETGKRPLWFPHEFDWVFGCAYRGLPESTGPLAHLIGANMSARAADVRAIGGFHSDDHDDMDMCHRLAHARPDGTLLYEPRAVVRHFVPASRTTWAYFWRRCFIVNRGKVEAFANMGGAAHLGAELAFVVRALTRGVASELAGVLRGRPAGAARAAAIVVGIVLAGLGNLTGRMILFGRRHNLPFVGKLSVAVPSVADADAARRLAQQQDRTLAS
jgi:glycosyltransferase involved in cell wall biosynthesis